MRDLFPIIEVPEDATQETEYLGTKFKFWFRQDGLDCLYKQARINTGEAWSEKMASELCQLLNLPHADYELAIWNDNLGTISPSFVPPHKTLMLGNDFLVKTNPNYPKLQTFRVSEHTLDVVVKAMVNSSVNLPLNWSPPTGIQTPVETFVAYLLLDAWIGNTDRHHENWGFIVNKLVNLEPTNLLNLAPTFDHASSLGRELQDNKRREKLKNKTVNNYAAKSRSGIYAKVGDRKAMLTLDVFEEAAARYPQAALIWLQRLANISEEDILSLFARVPEEFISEISIEFARQILTINRHRLLQIGEKLR
jgi:hypothetical protein